jgi:ubiquinone biosynthesis UbiH/UbiF/VisC/COQ6 family hydroxylase
MNADVVIVGAGPSGLCLARALSGQGLGITLIEKQSLQEISEPSFDGREIALTQESVRLIKDLGLWSNIEPHAISQLRDAKILNGHSSFSMNIPHQLGRHQELGWLISNHLIREAAFKSVQQANNAHHDITILTDQKVTNVSANNEIAVVNLEGGIELKAQLIIAADSRFSDTRQMMGIAAEMHDFGKNMLVCCMSHEKPHEHIAWEWFDYGQTLALLPMNPDPVTGEYRSSVVITVGSQEIKLLMEKSAEEFSQEVTKRFMSRLGIMRLISTKHSYPLVSVYPKNLVASRFATIGDAAVGMHPITAHGFNFGLLGVKTLAREIIHAKQAGLDIGGTNLLLRYQRRHRAQTRPLFLITRLITDIYTKESHPAKILRKLLIHAGENLRPLKRVIALSLSGSKYIGWIHNSK